MLLAVDVTVYHNGYHGDLNETEFVGKVDEAGQNLVQVAYKCLMKGIAIGRPCGMGLSGGDVGSVCECRYTAFCTYIRVYVRRYMDDWQLSRWIHIEQIRMYCMQDIQWYSLLTPDSVH